MSVLDGPRNVRSFKERGSPLWVGRMEGGDVWDERRTLTLQNIGGYLLERQPFSVKNTFFS